MKSPALFLFWFVLFGAFTASSQDINFSVKWGKALDASRRASLDDVVGYDETGIYVVKVRAKTFGGESYSLDHFDTNFSLTNSFDLDIEENGIECDVLRIAHLRNRLYIFYSYPDRKSKKHFLLVDEIDKATLKPMKQAKTLGTVSNTETDKYYTARFSVRVSRDSTKLLTFYTLPDSNGEPETYGFHVMDIGFNTLWKKSFSIPYKSSLFDVESVRVDDEGNVYLLGLLFKDKRKSKRKGEPNYTHEIFSYTNKGANSRQYTVSLDDRFITDLQMEILNNQLICAGFYSQKGTFSIRGTYYLTLDAVSGEIKSKSFKEFGIDFITQNMTDRQAKKAKRKEEKGDDQELYDYRLDRLVLGDDGSAVLIGEQYFVRVVTSTSVVNNSTRTISNYYYYYNDILVTRINPAGQIQWAEKIAKTQRTVNDGGFYSSYALAVVDDKVCFIFNDSPDNLAPSGNGRPDNYNARKSVTVIVAMDAAGKQVKKPIFSSVDAEVITRPKVCEQISQHEMILFGQRGKKHQFARMTFK